MFDTIVIGAGIIGCATARALSLYDLNVCVLEAQSDLAEGTTKANSAIVHAGYDAKPGTDKARYNVRGNALYHVLSRELDVPFVENGSLVLCEEESQIQELEALKARGEQNGVPGLSIVRGEALRAMEPHLHENIVAALYAPTGGITCPYGMAQAMAENAVANGATFVFDSKVQRIAHTQDGFAVYCDDRVFHARTVVNAAGLYADEVARMAGTEVPSITPRKGEYCIFDQQAGSLVSHTLFQLPTKWGKGVLVTPTVDGNLMVGPSADDQDDKDDCATTQQGLAFILERAQQSVQSLPTRQIITSFAGLRARPENDDFTVKEDERIRGLYHASGIESPGLTAAPAIAEQLCDWIVQALDAKEKAHPVRTRTRIRRIKEMTPRERDLAIMDNPAYGQIICRCETVSEAEVVEAIHRAPGARTIDGVKRRTRCGMGRCQGGFCMPRVAEILERELKLMPDAVTKRGAGSEITIGALSEVRPCK